MEPVFFRLPLELRHQIYGYIFDVQHGTIEPIWTARQQRHRMFHENDGRSDSDASWAKVNNKPGYPVSEVTSLLQVNHQICDEASEVLYGRHTFYFDDFALYECILHPYPLYNYDRQLEDKCHKLDVGHYCDFCNLYWNNIEQGRDTSDPLTRCWNMKSGKHIDHLPRCGISSSADWLKSIGSRNASQIRKTRLEFTDEVWVGFPPTWYKRELVESFRKSPRAVGGEVLRGIFQHFGENLFLTSLLFSVNAASDGMRPRLFSCTGYRLPHREIVKMWKIIHIQRDLFLSGSRFRPLFEAMISNGRLRNLEVENLPSGWESELREADMLEELELMQTVQREKREIQGLVMLEKSTSLTIEPSTDEEEPETEDEYLAWQAGC